MRLTLHFENREAVLIATAESDEEKKMLGVIASRESGEVEGEIDLKHQGHFTHFAAEYLRVRIRAKKPTPEASLSERSV